MKLSTAEKLRIWSLGNRNLDCSFIACAINRSRGWVEPWVTPPDIRKLLFWLKSGRR